MEIKVGKIYRHKHGLRYRVDSIEIHDVTGYESGKSPVEYVLYTQLEAGKYPAGKQWVREKQDFIGNFSEDKKSSGFDKEVV